MKQFFKMIFASCLGVVVASIVVMIIFFSMMGSFVSSITSALTSPTETAKVTTKFKGQHLLMIEVEGEISDKKESDLFGTMLFDDSDEDPKHYTLAEIVKALELAKNDSRIDGAVLKLEKAVMGYATAHELRQALQAFAAEKRLISYAESYDYKNYYVSSVSHELLMNPAGMLDMSGLSSTTLFFPQVLKKVGVEMQVFKVGTFKGAVEPYTGTQLSEANRMQIETYLSGLWSGTLSEISQSIEIPTDSLQRHADLKGGFASYTDITAAHLVDSSLYATDLDEHMAQLLYEGDKEKVRYLTVGEYLSSAKEDERGEQIALLYAEGEITESSNSNPFNEVSVIDRDLVDKLRKLADDDDVKAVVMRVNSPGGSAFISELIHHEVVRLREKKPIVISMGNYAASGGYYISCAANTIVADPYTLTGSIGIFGMFPNFAGTANKLGLTYDTVKTAEMADFGNTFRPMTPQEKASLQGYIERGYDLFISRVAEGRGITKEQVNEIGQGRVWIGSKALEIGLVDKLGSLQDAIDEAARLAELEEYHVVTSSSEESFFDMLRKLNIAEIGSAIYTQFLLSPEERLLRDHLSILQRRRGVMALPPFDLEATSANLSVVHY